jgi:hypothetical protein
MNVCVLRSTTDGEGAPATGLLLQAGSPEARAPRAGQPRLARPHNHGVAGVPARSGSTDATSPASAPQSRPPSTRPASRPSATRAMTNNNSTSRSRSAHERDRDQKAETKETRRPGDQGASAAASRGAVHAEGRSARRAQAEEAGERGRLRRTTRGYGCVSTAAADNEKWRRTAVTSKGAWHRGCSGGRGSNAAARRRPRTTLQRDGEPRGRSAGGRRSVGAREQATAVGAAPRTRGRAARRAAVRGLLPPARWLQPVTPGDAGRARASCAAPPRL